MAEKIAFLNLKGGVAKSFSCHNIAAALGRKGKRVLMIDLDSQASLTLMAGLEPLEHADFTISDVLSNDRKQHKDIEECVVQTPSENVWIVPSIIDLAAIEMQMLTRIGREKILAKAIAPVEAAYDYILFDCPPQLGTINLNAMSCADGVLIPCKTDYISYRGMTNLVEKIGETQDILNPGLAIYGVIATIHEKSASDDRNVLQLLEEEYKVVAVIGKRKKIGSGIFDGRTIVEIEPKADISQAYMRVADMVIAKEFVEVAKQDGSK